jgi:hypothetical protein
LKTKWADLRAYPGYQVSNKCCVRDKHKNTLAIRLDSDGNACVRMWVNGVRQDLPVDFLAAYAFHGIPSARHRVVHLKGYQDDPSPDRLAWAEPPIDYAQLMQQAPPHRGYPARIDASALTLVCSEYSAHWGTNIYGGN